MKYIPGDIEKRLIRISNRMGLEVEHSNQALTQLSPAPPLTYFDSAQLAHEISRARVSDPGEPARHNRPTLPSHLAEIVSTWGNQCEGFQRY